MNTSTNSTSSTLLDLNAMVEQTLDTVPDAPDYSNPPAGSYNLLVKDVKIDSYKNKAQEDCQRLKITYSVMETIEVADPKESPVPDGTMFTETFQATEMGLSFFKGRIKGIMNVSDLNGVSLGDMMNSSKGTTFACKISIKKSPKKVAGVEVAGEFYENLMIKVIPQSN